MLLPSDYDQALYREQIALKRADDAEARAAARTELIDSILATWEQMTDRLLEVEARAAQLEAANAEHEQTILALRGNLEYVQAQREIAEQQALIGSVVKAVTPAE